MVTHTLKLKDINEGFDLIHNGESIRSVVIYGDAIPCLPARCAWRSGRVRDHRR
jgi:hypothetical protein